MSSPDKCPHCGADPVHSSLWVCGTHAFRQTEYCRERAAHAATRKELANYKAECGIARDQRRDAENERRNETHRANLAESRVRELEGLEIAQEVGVSEDRSWLYLSVPFETKRSKQPKTIGEAMPRRSEK